MSKASEKALIEAAYQRGYDAGARSTGGWIPVGGKMPEVGEIVLVAHRPAGGALVRVGRLVTLRRFLTVPGGWDVSLVTHWRPLPPPPPDGE
jgi:hypothetical protein